jgi:hypothetical protein
MLVESKRHSGKSWPLFDAKQPHNEVYALTPGHSKNSNTNWNQRKVDFRR